MYSIFFSLKVHILLAVIPFVKPFIQYLLCLNLLSSCQKSFHVPTKLVVSLIVLTFGLLNMELTAILPYFHQHQQSTSLHRDHVCDNYIITIEIQL